MVGNIGTTATLILIVVMFLGGLSAISTDILKNNNLDNSSKNLLTDLNDEYSNNYNSSFAFNTSTSNVTNESTFSGVDAFARQYLEDKSETEQKKSVINRVVNFPSLFLKMFGVDNQVILNIWNTAIYGFIAFLLGLQIYKAIRTGEVG